MNIIGHNNITQILVALFIQQTKEFIDSVVSICHLYERKPTLASKGDKINARLVYRSVYRHGKKVNEQMLHWQCKVCSIGKSQRAWNDASPQKIPSGARFYGRRQIGKEFIRKEFELDGCLSISSKPGPLRLLLHPMLVTFGCCADKHSSLGRPSKPALYHRLAMHRRILLLAWR